MGKHGKTYTEYKKELGDEIESLEEDISKKVKHLKESHLDVGQKLYFDLEKALTYNDGKYEALEGFGTVKEVKGEGYVVEIEETGENIFVKDEEARYAGEEEIAERFIINTKNHIKEEQDEKKESKEEALKAVSDSLESLQNIYNNVSVGFPEKVAKDYEKEVEYLNSEIETIRKAFIELGEKLKGY